MSVFNITSTTVIDGVTLRSNTQSLEVKSIMDYTKTLTTSYLDLVTGSDQPTLYSQVFLTNTGTETALIRSTPDGTNFYFTALPPGNSMSCPMRTSTQVFNTLAARGEGGATTLRVIALYI